MTSRGGVTRARDQSSLSKSELSAKFFKLAGPQQSKKVQLNYKSTMRNNTPSIVHLSKHLTGLNKLEEDRELFEKSGIEICMKVFDRCCTVGMAVEHLANAYRFEQLSKSE